jgi:signal transduction histidine kinase
MSVPYTVLEWADRSLSLFNTIVVLWLGAIVLLHAGRRRWDTWLACGGMALAGLFFAGHSTIVGQRLNATSGAMSFWWHAIWLAFIIWPLLWYAIVAWYTDAVSLPAHRRLLIGAGISGIVALIAPAILPIVPPYEAILKHETPHILTLGGVPAILFYAIYCIAGEMLALAALRAGGRSPEFMNDPAHRQSYPWLVATSYVLLGVAVTVSIVAVFVIGAAQARQLDLAAVATQTVLVAVDTAISLLIAVVIVFVGEAVISYEIFTGNALPQSRLAEQWRLVQLLAAYFAVLVGGSLELPLPPIYTLVLAIVLLALFVALVGWRAVLERQQAIEHLRPFVASQGLYEHLLDPASPVDVDGTLPFIALCADVLHAQWATLIAVGPLAPLVGPPICYPPAKSPPEITFADLLPRLDARADAPVVLSDDDEATWIVPLWSGRGLIGIVLLGAKRNGQLYTQEEIALARATGERIVDTQASAELARRLMLLQRERLVETQVADQRTRRELHDEILPRLHAVMLLLNAGQGDAQKDDALSLLAETHRQIAGLLQALPSARPSSVVTEGLFGALRQTMEGDFGGVFDEVTWEIAPEGESAASRLPAVAAEVVFGAAREAIRNAARYGRGQNSQRPLRLVIAAKCEDGLRIAIEDDGVGIDPAMPSHGSGQGLALHSTMMAVLGGTLTVERASGGGSRVILSLPEWPHPGTGPSG